MKALVTGASSGIGRDMAIYLGELGYDLVLVARNKKDLLKVKEKINTNVEIIDMDLSDINNCYKLHDKVKDIDILINNAGFGLFGEFSETDLDKEIEMINLNVIALHTLCKLYLKDFVEKDKGRILNVASIAGFMPGPLMSTYYATKNYVLRLSEAIKEELKKSKSNVSISVLCPGPVRTNFDNVANVKFSLKGQDSKYVGRYAIDKLLNNKFYIVPGFKIKCLRTISKIVPNRIMMNMVYNSQKRKS